MAGATVMTTQFTLPAGHTKLTDFQSVTAIANGIRVGEHRNHDVSIPSSF